jgi:hypothetical protein
MRLPSRLAAAAAIALVAVAACERAREQPRTDTTYVAPPADTTDSVVATPVASTWDATAGPALIVHDLASDDALVVPPEPGPLSVDSLADAIEHLTLDLVSPTGAAGRALVTAASPLTDPRCTGWLSVDLRPEPDARTREWTIAFAAGRATPLPLTPIETLPSADSARLAADIARLASALPDSADSPFRGIPFVVRSAYRFTPAPGRAAVVADLVRRLPQEAMPLEEHTLLVAERDSAAPDRAMTVAYSERTSATEERIITGEALGAVSIGGRTRLIVARLGYERTAYAILERSASGRWRVRWTSPSGC